MKNSTPIISRICGLLLLTGCADKAPPEAGSRVTELPYYAEATFTPLWADENGTAPDRLHRISDFSLVNQDGDTITERTFAGKVYVADFIFTTCPGICPRMVASMDRIQEAFAAADDVLLLSHSVTPERDSVPVLREFAREKGVRSGKWHVVTGAREDIYRLGREDYFVEEDLGLEKDPDEFLHTENFVLVDRDRHIRGIYNGLNRVAVDQLIADIRTLRLTPSP